MPRLPHKKISAPEPRRVVFDPWNSISGGHQRAEQSSVFRTLWRESRGRKLGAQFSAGFASDGGEILYDTVGAGSLKFGKDGRKANGGWDKSVSGARGKDRIGDEWEDLENWVEKDKSSDNRVKRLKAAIDEDAEEAICAKRREMREDRTRKESPLLEQAAAVPERCHDRAEGGRPLDSPPRKKRRVSRRHNPNLVPPPSYQIPPTPSTSKETPISHHLAEKSAPEEPVQSLLALPPSQIFAGLTFYILGSTYPHVSDHALRILLASYGGNVSLHLLKRKVTHVIIGLSESGGGVLAARKAQREVERSRGKGLKFVGVKWALECLQRGRRISETDFAVGLEGDGRRVEAGGGVSRRPHEGSGVDEETKKPKAKPFLGAGVGQRSVRDMFLKKV